MSIAKLIDALLIRYADTSGIGRSFFPTPFLVKFTRLRDSLGFRNTFPRNRCINNASDLRDCQFLTNAILRNWTERRSITHRLHEQTTCVHRCTKRVTRTISISYCSLRIWMHTCTYAATTLWGCKCICKCSPARTAIV